MAMRKPTIYEIKRGYEAENPNGHFFDRKTLKFYGETLKTLQVVRTEAPDWFLVITRYGKHYFHQLPNGNFEYRRRGLYA